MGRSALAKTSAEAAVKHDVTVKDAMKKETSDEPAAAPKRSQRDVGHSARVKADVAFVEALAKVLRDNELAELEVTREYGDDDELKIRLSRYAAATAAPAPLAAPAAPMLTAPAETAAAERPAGRSVAVEPAAEDPLSHPGCLTSPMVGMVYLSPEPGAGPFVSVGETVEKGQTVLIIEAMKTMNQIPSPRAGLVKKILVDNEQPVEFGAPLLIIE